MRPSSEGPGVVVIDDHPATRIGIAAAIGPAGVRLFAMGPTVLDPAILESGAHVAILDLELTDGSRLTDNVRILREAGMRVLIYAGSGNLASLSLGVAAGAVGVVYKDQPVTVLTEALGAILRGRTWLSVELTEKVHASRSTRPSLTDREIEVLSLLHQGKITKEVARRLDLQESTVKEHIKRVRHKYAAVGRPAVTRIELLNRVVEDGYLTRRA